MNSIGFIKMMRWGIPTALGIAISLVGCTAQHEADQRGKLTAATDEPQHPLSMASGFSAAFGIELTDDEWRDFAGWLDQGADPPVSPKRLSADDKHSIEVVHDFDRAVPGSAATYIRTPSGKWKLLLGGGNYGGEAIDYCLLIADDAEPDWVSHEEVRQLWDGVAVVLRGALDSTSQRLWTHQRTIDLGEVEMHSRKADTFFLNCTASEVKIADAKFSCTCGHVSFHQESIPAFGIVRAKVDVNATGKDEGPLRLGLLITTRPAAEGPLLVRVKAEVIHPTRLEPKLIDVGNVLSTSDPILVESVLHVKHPPAGTVFPAYLPEGLSWKRSVREGAGSVRVVLELDPARVPVGKFTLATAIGLSDAATGQETLHSLPISGRRLPELELAPNVVFVGQCQAGQKLQRTAQIIRNGVNEPVKATSANPDNVVATIKGETVELQIETPARPGPFELIVFVRSGGAYSLLPVRGVVERRVTSAESKEQPQESGAPADG